MLYVLNKIRQQIFTNTNDCLLKFFSIVNYVYFLKVFFIFSIF